MQGQLKQLNLPLNVINLNLLETLKHSKIFQENESSNNMNAITLIAQHCSDFKKLLSSTPGISFTQKIYNLNHAKILDKNLANNFKQYSKYKIVELNTNWLLYPANPNRINNFDNNSIFNKNKKFNNSQENNLSKDKKFHQKTEYTQNSKNKFEQIKQI